MANQPYISGTVAAGTAATLVCSPVTGAHGVLISNGGAASVFLGGSGVTTATGFPVAAAASVLVPTVGDSVHDLYAVVASGTANVSFLYPA